MPAWRWLFDPPDEVGEPTATNPSPPDFLGRAWSASLHDLRASAVQFVPNEETITAVNVALALGAPLLVTGDPGTGKTHLAYHLAWYLGVLDPSAQPADLTPNQDQPFRMHVKSTSVATDLLYTFDTVSYFHDAYQARRGDQDSVALNAEKHVRKGPLWLAFEALTAGPSVVLIDEIDKAPRDFPNDLLHELDQYEFRVKPLDNRPISRPRGVPPPLVVLTSNSEQRLPEPFLRRCVFLHLKLDADTVKRAVDRRFKGIEIEQDLKDEAIRRFWELHARKGDLRKLPSTGELLAWIHSLQARGVRAAALADKPVGELPHLGVLIKDHGDLEKLRGKR